MKQRYLTYDAEQLALDALFVDWVRQGRNDAAWSEWLAVHPERAPVVNEARHLVQRIRFKASPTPMFNADALWNRIDTATATAEPGPNVRPLRPIRRIWVAGGAAAAAVALILLYVLVLAPRERQFATELAQMEEVSLPDGSRVVLNADSRLTYDAETWKDNRVVQLEGEAFFEVQDLPDKASFSIQTDRGRVKVLGTSFNVFSRSEGFEVACVSGSVFVVTSRDSVILLKDDATRAVDERLVPLPEGPLNVSWLNGVYNYDNVPLGKVIPEIQRQFDVVIELQSGLEEIAITTGFQTNQSIDTVLEAITFPNGLNWGFSESGDVIQINR